MVDLLDEDDELSGDSIQFVMSDDDEHFNNGDSSGKIWEIGNDDDDDDDDDSIMFDRGAVKGEGWSDNEDKGAWTDGEYSEKNEIGKKC